MNRATLLLAAFLVAGPLAHPASAVSPSDLLNLQLHGLSDDVLVALIETDGSVFRLSSSDITRLRLHGMSEAVIVAMLDADKRAARKDAQTPRKPKPATPSSTTVIVGHADVVVVPVVVAVPAKPAEPLHWGFGGNARPGSWTPSEPEQARPVRR
jgi:hypothetical protein